MFNISSHFSGFLLVLIITLHIASGFRKKSTIGWSLAKAACSQSAAYGETRTLQSRLNDESVFSSMETGHCSKLMRTNCESTSCKRFECKGGAAGSSGALGSSGSSGASVSSGASGSSGTSVSSGASGSSGTSGSSGSKHKTRGASSSSRGTAPAGAVKLAELNGTFEYILLFDVDNSRNLGEIWYATDYQKVTRTSEDVLGNLLVDAIAKANANAAASLPIPDMFDIAVDAGIGGDLSGHLQATLTKHTDVNIVVKDASNYSIKANSSLLLYQLCFNGPGLDHRSDTITSSIIQDIEPVTFSITYSFANYLKDIKIVYTETDAAIPEDAIASYDQNEPTNLNHYTGSNRRIWLVPEWTDILDERVTYVLNVHATKPLDGYDSITNGSNAQPHYLKMVRNIREPHGITHLKIWRTKNPNELPSSAGFNFWTSDMSNGKEKDPKDRRYEYLCWQVRPVVVQT